MKSHSDNETQRILFVCAGNTCRSPMAAALAGHLLGKGTQVESAGSSANEGTGATPEAVKIMMERGLNIGGHRSRPLRMVNVADFDLVVALTPAIAQELRDKGVDPAKLHSLNIRDPIDRGDEIYRETAVAIERDLKHLFGLDHDARPK